MIRMKNTPKYLLFDSGHLNLLVSFSCYCECHYDVEQEFQYWQQNVKDV